MVLSQDCDVRCQVGCTPDHIDKEAIFSLDLENMSLQGGVECCEGAFHFTGPTILSACPGNTPFELPHRVVKLLAPAGDLTLRLL